MWPKSSLLGSLTDDDRSALLALGVEQERPVGALLIREATTDTTVHAVLRGCVKVMADTNGGHPVLLAVRLPGEIVGELAAADGEPRTATVVTAANTLVRTIDRRSWTALLVARPGIAKAVDRTVREKLRRATRMRVELGDGSALIKLTRVLHGLALTHGRRVREGTLIDISLSQPEYAGLIGASDPSVQRALAVLRAKSVLSTGHRMIVIRDMAELKRMAFA